VVFDPVRVICIIQARTGSTRLPNKVLMKVAGKEILRHVIDRVLRSLEIDHIVVATTDQDGDEKIVQLVSAIDNRRVTAFRGSENDVLDRFYRAAHAAEATTIVRITADCPLIDWLLIDKIVHTFKRGKYDYVSNVLGRRTYPRGLDVECMTFTVLEWMWKHCPEIYDREHVTTYIRNHADKFRTKNIEHQKDLSGYRWTLDEKADLEFIEEVYQALAKPTKLFTTEDILELLEKDPELARINEHVEQKPENPANR
jgi:spore coat polysaccharide biosynthesis protein SpsF